MTVLDTSGVIDFLLGADAFDDVAGLLGQETVAAVPDLLTFEVVAVLRREALRGTIDPERAKGAVEDLADLTIDVFPTLPLRSRVWELRNNMSAADGFFVALAERLEEPLATKDRSLATAARSHTGIQVVLLGDG